MTRNCREAARTGREADWRRESALLKLWTRMGQKRRFGSWQARLVQEAERKEQEMRDSGRGETKSKGNVECQFPFLVIKKTSLVIEDGRCFSPR
jgi:hypothetical protein